MDKKLIDKKLHASKALKRLQDCEYFNTYVFYPANFFDISDVDFDRKYGQVFNYDKYWNAIYCAFCDALFYNRASIRKIKDIDDRDGMLLSETRYFFNMEWSLFDFIG